MQTEEILFAGRKISLDIAGPSKIDILPLLKNPEDFHGDRHVQYIIHFADLFTSLIGKFGGAWQGSELTKRGIVVLQDYYDWAKTVMDQINTLAEKLVANPRLYDDKSLCRDYYELTKEGYRLLDKHQNEFNFPTAEGVLVSLERAGLVTTRLALGIDKDTTLKDEVKVVTKRIHLKNEPNSYLSATVKWRQAIDLELLNKSSIIINDFVNPATGASTAAFLLAAKAENIVPRRIFQRSISGTKQGMIFMHQALKEFGIEPLFYSLGVADTLNDKYYLMPPRAVGDAGDMLSSFLPAWYMP